MYRSNLFWSLGSFHFRRWQFLLSHSWFWSCDVNNRCHNWYIYRINSFHKKSYKIKIILHQKQEKRFLLTVLRYIYCVCVCACMLIRLISFSFHIKIICLFVSSMVTKLLHIMSFYWLNVLHNNQLFQS